MCDPDTLRKNKIDPFGLFKTMNMDKKYYTPEIEEFHVGFEVDRRVSNMHTTKNDVWARFTVTQDYLSDIDLFDVRVKHLDREDIESLGLEFKYNEKGNENIAFTKKYENHPRYDNQYVDIIWNYASRRVLICEGDNETGWDEWVTRFSGTIKNKSELKKVLKMLGI